jgi:type IV pilus assembly protein PilY1
MMRIDFDTMRRTLRKPLVRGVGVAAGVVVAGAVGLLARESRSGDVPKPAMAACCSSALAIGDSMMTPSVGADKDFFEIPSSPPSAIFLLGNNESMLDFPEYLPEAFTPGYYDGQPATRLPPKIKRGLDSEFGHFTNTGCSDPALVAAMSWYDRSSADPAKNGSVVYDADADFGPTPFFEPDKFYHARGRRIAWAVEDYPWAVSAATSSLSTVSAAQSACYQITDWEVDDGWYDSDVMDECEKCLATKGWWRGPLITTNTGTLFDDDDFPPSRKTHITGQEPPPPEAYRKWILNGRLLNVRPPKFVVARKVLKDVINMAPNVRMGVATFGRDHGWFDPPEILEGLRPTCDLSFPTINETALDRSKLMKAVNRTQFRNNERSIGEALFGLGGYFSSQRRDNKWENWFKQPINPGYFGWPGCCSFSDPKGTGTYDNADTGQDGEFYGVTADEWLKPPKWVGATYLPGQPFEGWDPNDRSVCFGCQVSSVIVLTDGAPKYDNSVPITKMMEYLKAKNAKHPDGTPLRFDPVDPETNPDVGGVNYCDQFEKSPGVKYTKADCDYGMADHNWPTGLGVGNKNFMDDVAFFLANMDLRDDMPGTQSVRTYTIGYGDNSAMLQSIALAGKGKFYRANNGTELRDSIINALGDLKQLSTSFASANISSVQTGGMQSSVYVPRFIPRRGRPYEGHLYRFFYYSEFAQGCEDAKAKSTAKDPRDLNQDGDCDDTFFLDKPAGFSGGVPDISSFTTANIVQENVEGNWVKVITANLTPEGKLEGGTPAKPFWDVGETVGKRKAALKCDPDNPLGAETGRCILTLIDKNNDGKFDQYDNPPIEFHEDNLAKLKSYLLAGGDAFCSTLFAKQKKGTWTGSTAQQDDCATQLIRFVRGMDVFDYDGDSILNEERPCADNKKPEDPTSCKLADIFHSTPVTVEPPVEPFLCTLGLSGQCVSTLYDDFSNSVSSEPRCASGGGGKPCYKPTPLSPGRGAGKKNGAYDDYRTTHAKRDRIALVGSNGGMIHAIHVGSATTREKTSALDDIHDIGTGQELWAFVPPDLLPKLGLMVNGHEYFVDGTPMVRDIWADGAPAGDLTDRKRDGTKQAGEFRTIAVITERGGGQRYVALDVTDPYLMLKGLKAPGDASLKPFRWMFPNACDAESGRMGQSWSNFAPKPPPIGPVRLQPTTTAASTDIARGWEERWVTVLNGGFSPDLSRGRGVYMVDAWTGEKLWSAEANPGNGVSTPYGDVLNQMGPVVASPALVDIGKAENVQLDLDGFFDTLVVGDMVGQAWTFRFKEPGAVDTTTGQVTNWYGARSLEMAREDGSTIGPKNVFEKAPFFHVPSTVLQPETGWLRSFMGTGDRQHLRTTPGTDCGPDDLLACLRLKCDVTASFVSDVNGQKRTSTLEYVGGVLTKNEEKLNGALAAACTGSKMELTELSIACPTTALGSGTYPSPWTGSKRTFKTESWCKDSGGLWSCDRVTLNTSEHPDLKLDAAEKKSVANNRYFGFHSYGGVKRKFKDAAGAVAFDTMRVTDKPGFSCGTGVTCSLVDVTIPDSEYQYLPPDPSGFRQRYLPTSKLAGLKRGQSEGPGWFVRYDNTLLERTAAGSTVLAGVVFWPTFSPSSGVGAAACSLTGLGDMSYSWQADVITGLPDMAEGFRVRDSSGNVIGYITGKGRGTNAPPGEGSPIISLSKTGGIRYEVAVTSPGDAPKTEKLRDRKNVTPDISWMEVPRNLHECRHQNAQACSR